jgi:hypothetical protein
LIGVAGRCALFSDSDQIGQPNEMSRCANGSRLIFKHLTTMDGDRAATRNFAEIPTGAG